VTPKNLIFFSLFHFVFLFFYRREMSPALIFRNSNNAAGVLSRCVFMVSRGPLGWNACEASGNEAFDLWLQRRGIASRGGFDDDLDAASRLAVAAAHPSTIPDDLARVASGAAADVASVVNQLNSVRRRIRIVSFSFMSISFSFFQPFSPSFPLSLSACFSTARERDHLSHSKITPNEQELESFFGSGLPSGPSGGSSGSSSSGSSSSFTSSSSSSSFWPPPPPPPPPRKAPSSSPPPKKQPPTPPSLTHVDTRTGAASMVDVGAKKETRRVAVARGRVLLGTAAAFEAVRANAIAKGDVLSLARVAGILGAKAVPSLIPLCHTVVIDRVRVSAKLDKSKNSVELEAEAAATGKTGVEMEALAAVSAAALTVYDMTKALAKGSVISDVRLVRKEGGKSGAWRRGGEEEEGEGGEGVV